MIKVTRMLAILWTMRTEHNAKDLHLNIDGCSA